MLDFLESAGRDQHLALLMVEFAFHLMQLLDNINKDSFQVSPNQEFSIKVNSYNDWTCVYRHCTVRTVAADLRRGGHIPKMQNNIGRKSMLCVLRQLRSKEGGALGAVPCRAVPGHAALGLALGSAQLP